ncbi:MAG TPA: hypothetical protein VFT65_07965 [Candidatus Angelobacter sp.]|nr:hypothetical protein [Candidatus Angelobacter sp.]
MLRRDVEVEKQLTSSRMKIHLLLLLAIAGLAILLVPLRSGRALAAPRSQQQDAPATSSNNTPHDSSPISCSAAVSIDHMGTVSVGCPKVWRSDRVFSVLDGIMRDVDSMTVRALEGLDANAANQAAIDLIQNSFDLTAKYDQAAAINNQFALQKLKTARTNEVAAYNSDAAFRQKLTQQRNDLTQQLIDTQARERQQTQAGASAPDIQATQQAETSLQNQITNINNTLNTNPPSISDASLASTASTTINSTDQPQHATLDKLPQGFQDALTNLLKQPTFPPAIQMDNVIDLLHQRIAREFSVIYDDLMRDSDKYDVYLVQFDTSINPEPGARDRGVHVAMEFTGCGATQPNALPLAYELYPSAAAYNIMHGFNQTTHTGVTGMAQTIVGFGLQASFQHDHSSLRSGLSQSLYASGFGAGQNKFGWDFAAAPDENRLAPGLRTTYAILRVPKGCGESVQAKLRVEWPKRDRRYPGWNPFHWIRSDAAKNATNALSVEFPHNHALQLTHVSYVPADTGEKGNGDSTPQKPPPAAAVATPASSAGAAAAAPAAEPAATPKPAVIQVRFLRPIDPNLVVTVNDQILKRVRDVRGRGLYSDSTTALHLAGNAAETAAITGSRFGLLESDTLGEDTWLQADSHTILLNIGWKTAGTDHFPVVRIIDPSSGGGSELTELARQADEVRIGEWFFTQPTTLTSASFQPLYTKPYDPGPFRVFIQKVTRDATDKLQDLELRLVSYATTRTGHKPIYLHDQAQVVLEADVIDHKDRYRVPVSVNPALASRDQALLLRPNWAMVCRQDRGALVCAVPIDEMRSFCHAAQSADDALGKNTGQQQTAPETLDCLSNFKIWLDQAPYYGRAGLWGDADLDLSKKGAAGAAHSSSQPAGRNGRPSAQATPPSGSDQLRYQPVLLKTAQQQNTTVPTKSPKRQFGLEALKESDEDFLWRGNYEIRERRHPGSDFLEWLVQLEILDSASVPGYTMQEFGDLAGNITERSFVAGHPAQARAANRQAMAANDEKTRNLLQKYFSDPGKECSKSGDPQSAFHVCTERRKISFTVPFALFSFLPETLHLQRASDPDSILELPGLSDQIVPHNLKIVKLNDKTFQFQGAHLKAVNGVQLVAPGKPVAPAVAPLATSANVVDVLLDDKPCADVPCPIQLTIGGDRATLPGTIIDLTRTDESGKEIPQTIPDIAPAAEKPKPAAQTATPGSTQTATATTTPEKKKK